MGDGQIDAKYRIFKKGQTVVDLVRLSSTITFSIHGLT